MKLTQAFKGISLILALSFASASFAVNPISEREADQQRTEAAASR